MITGRFNLALGLVATILAAITGFALGLTRDAYFPFAEPCIKRAYCKQYVVCGMIEFEKGSRLIKNYEKIHM